MGHNVVFLNKDLSWVFGGPNLSVAKTDGLTTANPGDKLTYTIDVENLGTVENVNSDADATGIVLTEVVPSGTTLDLAGSTLGWECGGEIEEDTVCTLDVQPLDIGESAPPVNFVVDVKSPATVTEVVNTASVTDDGASGPDNDPLDNQTTDTTTLNIPCNSAPEDLTLTSPTMSGDFEHTACNSITAGVSYNVAAGRNVGFRTRNFIVLQDGFLVESGATFTATLDPLVGQ